MGLSASILALAAVGGLIVGFLLVLFGGGGSVLATPWLMFVVGIADPHRAIGTSALAVAANAAIGLFGQARAGRVKWPCASVFAFCGLAGSLIGAHFALQVDGKSLLFWFALAMLSIAIAMLRTPKNVGNPEVHLNQAMVFKLAPVGFLAGLAAGFFGIGGGFLIAPGLMASTGMTLSNAAASSLFSVTLFGAATSGSYGFAGLVDWPIAATTIAGGLVGTRLALPLSAKLAHRANLNRRLFAGLIALVAIYVGWSAIH